MKKLIALMSLIFVLSFSLEAKADEIDLPDIIQILCWEVGNEFDISPTLLMSLVYQESRGIEKNKTQITNMKWFKEGIEYCQADNPKGDDYQNIRICGYYLNKWFKELGDADVYLIAECWNEGFENAISTHGKPSRYSREVVDRATEWTEIWEEKSARIRP